MENGKTDRKYLPKWLVVEGTDKERPLSSLSPFALSKGIQGLAGEPKSLRRMRSGALLVEVEKEKHAELLLKSKVLVNCPIRVSAHNTLNSSKGVMRCRELRGVTEQEILEELADQGVTKVTRATIRKAEKREPTDTFFLTFRTPELLKTIKVGYLRVKIPLYVPTPLRCFKCQKFGHIRERCKEKENCG